VGWHSLEEKSESTKANTAAREDAHRALAAAATQALAKDTQEPLKRFLMNKANSVSYRAGAAPAEVAFDEGQRSLALQILKLAGEIK